MSSPGRAIEELIEIMERLLAPDGCPWDREQTHQSLQRYLIEECYEVIDAIQENNMDKLKEELGDVLLQVVFHAALASREGNFDFADVADTVKDKMVERHPHVFGSLQLKTSHDVLDRWEGFKKEKKYILEGIPSMLPALMRAEKVQEKAARVGFDWPDVTGALEKVKEEMDELAQANNQQEIEEEMGDLLFAMVNVARFKGVEPEAALQACNDKFARRFNYIEDRVRLQGKKFNQLSLEELDLLWDEAKGRGL